MSILSRAADLGYAFRFLKLLTTPWNKLKAYELGIVDENGKNLKRAKELKTKEEKSAYTIFHRLVFNIKRLLNKIPGGKSTLASYAAALYLIKEHTGMSEEKIEEIITKVLDDNLETDLTESQWFIKGDTLNPGIYCLTKDVVSMNTGEAIAKKNSKIRVEEHTEPYSSFLGNNIYKVQHVLTKQELYISNEDIKR
tara:strand:+ start:2878 stop:3465 length:588 start_codon:yes stop_codon:yes gene_type:complete